MESQLNDVEVRVLGCLIEKEMSTPMSYPLTLNSLTTACNQKSSRDPVTDYDENVVVRALESLRQKRLVDIVFPGTSRVAKYKHNFAYNLGLSAKLQALLCVLMLRGPQTVGELRTRTERMASFDDLAAVTEAMTDLANRDEGALAVLLPPGHGQKERRYAHLLSGEPDIAEYLARATPDPVRADSGGDSRLTQLENRVMELEQALEGLRADFDSLRADATKSQEQSPGLS